MGPVPQKRISYFASKFVAFIKHWANVIFIVNKGDRGLIVVQGRHT